jgi:hypothetical protein
LSYLDGNEPVFITHVVKDENGDLVHHPWEELLRMINSEVKVMYVELGVASTKVCKINPIATSSLWWNMKTSF